MSEIVTVAESVSMEYEFYVGNGVITCIVIIDLITEGNKEQLINNISERKQEKNIMSERPRTLHVTPEHFTGNKDVRVFLRQYSMITKFNNWLEKDKIKFLPIFVRGTARKFLDNLYNIRDNWTGKEIEEAFIEQYLPIGHITISNRGATISEYTNMLNLQVIKLQKYHDEKERYDEERCRTYNLDRDTRGRDYDTNKDYVRREDKIKVRTQEGHGNKIRTQEHSYYNRQDSRDRQMRSRTPERYRKEDRQ
ncbi:hypothetical protein AGLY_008847 [Aphis glycines]|uniref:Uncharacterized protein n=1 Tax=Aphis glycines TaxID=307491 RepID=A0A6G0TLZ8_APHGL|nr:hypothetical protein AGLY_008847 [Aphis glycines]